ncbi:MAG: hypothetical protein NTW25_08685 [Candidatus Kapabacteria bacterium]|nr:hypothetical protein [Candidatus Kapabacteria bacterium]
MIDNVKIISINEGVTKGVVKEDPKSRKSDFLPPPAPKPPVQIDNKN